MQNLIDRLATWWLSRYREERVADRARLYWVWYEQVKQDGGYTPVGLAAPAFRGVHEYE